MDLRKLTLEECEAQLEASFSRLRKINARYAAAKAVRDAVKVKSGYVRPVGEEYQQYVKSVKEMVDLKRAADAVEKQVTFLKRRVKQPIVIAKLKNLGATRTARKVI